MSTSSLSISLIYVPSDVGSIIPGKSKAPEAFRSVNVVSKLQDAGYSSVHEYHALSSPATYISSPLSSSGVRNEAGNIAVCEAVRGTVAKSFRDNGAKKKNGGEAKPSFQLILGGECCMLPAILSSFWDFYQPKKVGLIYIDADTDLSCPSPFSGSGTFASMNMTHLLQNPGCLESMRQFSRPDGSAVCDSENTVLFGTNLSLQSNTRAHFAYLFSHAFRVFPSSSIAQDATEQAREALQYLEARVDVIFVHLDVDSIDPSEFPLANVPNFTGVRFGDMMQALDVFIGSEKTQGLCIAEVNPDHDPELKMVEKMAGSVANMLGQRINRG